MKKIITVLKLVKLIQIITILFTILISIYFIGNYQNIASFFISTFFILVALILILDIKN